MMIFKSWKPLRLLRCITVRDTGPQSRRATWVTGGKGRDLVAETMRGDCATHPGGISPGDRDREGKEWGFGVEGGVSASSHSGSRGDYLIKPRP